MSRVSCFFLTHGVVGWPIADSSLTKWPPVDHRWVKSGESPLARDQCPYHWATPLYALVAWLIVRTTEVKLKQNSFKTVTKLFWNRFETVYISVSFNLCGQFYKRSNNYISTTFSHQKLVVVEYKRIYTRKKTKSRSNNSNNRITAIKAVRASSQLLLSCSCFSVFDRINK